MAGKLERLNDALPSGLATENLFYGLRADVLGLAAAQIQDGLLERGSVAHADSLPPRQADTSPEMQPRSNQDTTLLRVFWRL
jgi:hypothetical protein